MFYFFGQRKLRLSGGAVRPALPREPQESQPLHDPRAMQILREQLQSLTEDRDRWAARACAAEERLAVRERDGGAVRSLIAAWREGVKRWRRCMYSIVRDGEYIPEAFTGLAAEVKRLEVLEIGRENVFEGAEPPLYQKPHFYLSGTARERALSDSVAEAARMGLPADVVFYVNPESKMTAAEHEAWLKSLESELRFYGANRNLKP